MLSDDLASMNYRTKGQQIAPLIIRTRGHRLEGIWYSITRWGPCARPERHLPSCS